MSDKFTKGPWKVGKGCDYENGKFPITAVYDDRCIYVACASGDREVITDRERHANARLIASSPELFAMVEKLILHHGESHTCETCKEARALLAKVKGEKL